MDTIKGLALIATFIGVPHHLRHVGVAMGERVASLSRAYPIEVSDVEQAWGHETAQRIVLTF